MENRLLRFAQLALAVARRVVPDRASRFAPGIFTQPQLLTCLLLKEHLRLNYRTAEDLIATADGLRAILALRRVPDHTTLWWFARHRLTPDLVRAALAETVRRVACEGEPRRQVALDSTGLWLSYSSRYFRWRAKRERGLRGWLKWALALWVRPQLVLAQRVRPGPCGDFSDLVPLASAAHAVFPFDELLADAGYDSEANHVFCRERLGVVSLIRAKARRSTNLIATTPYRREMCRRARCARRRGEPARLSPALENRDGHIGGQAQMGRGADRADRSRPISPGPSARPRLQPPPIGAAQCPGMSFSTEQGTLSMIQLKIL